MEVRIRRIKPVKASPAVSRRVRHHCEAILEAGPGNEAGNRTRLDLEHLLLLLLHGAGLRGVERVVRDAGVAGLQRVAGDGPGLRRWTTLAVVHQADVMISVWSSKVLRAVSVNWYALPQQPKTRKERELKQLQDQFYARYMEAGDRAYATPPQRISAADRQILLVGELEADVNNGGFSQYLFNKGRRRAGAALRALDAIGATSTAAMLRAAMAASPDEDTLQKLGAKFYRSREDLAVLAIRHVKPLSPKP